MSTVTIVANEDAYVLLSQPNTNFGSNPYLYIGRGANASFIYRSYLYFNLSNIPVSSTINSATLNLYLIDKPVPGDLEVSIYRTLNTFNENSVTYNNQPAIAPTGIMATIGDMDLHSYIQIDITTLVQGWLTGSISNTGLAILGDETMTSLMGFTSTEFSNNNFWPFLEVDFTDPCNGEMINNMQQIGEFIIYESNTLLMNERILGTFTVENTGITSGIAILQILNGNNDWVDKEADVIDSGDTKVLTTTASRQDERISIVSIINPVVGVEVGGTYDANSNLQNVNGVALQYSSSNPDIPVDLDTGIVDISQLGTTTITINAQNVTNSPTISFELEVILAGDVLNFTQGITYATIQAAINDADPGDVILVSSGNFPENVTIDRRISLIGSGIGNTMINPAAGNGINITAGGDSTTERLIISNLTVTAPVHGIQTSGTSEPSHITLQGIASINNGNNGFNTNNAPANPNINDVIINDSDLSGNVTAGFRVATYVNVDGLSVNNTTMNNNEFGLLVFAQVGVNTFTNIDITNSQFNNNTSKGMYFEKLNDAIFSEIIVDSSGTAGAFAAGIDINLKQGNYQNVTIIDSTVTNSGNGDPVNGANAVIKGRDDGGNNGFLNNVMIIDSIFSDGPVGIRFGETGQNNTTPTNASVSDSLIENNVIGIQNTTLATVALSNNTFVGNGTDTIGSFS
ncbi:MAG: DNRLRE domain-containing protein [Eubacteriales bacterium]